ncbi:MAG: hypothetical protein JXM70_13925 [Pirellulales bacterium]|nr:hypothetical protein [Pirellulales bacterium]
MRGLFGLLAISLFLISAIVGCRPSGPTEEMGTVVDEVPAVEGAEKPYVIPELGPTTSEAKEGGDSKPVPTAKPDQEIKPKAVAEPGPATRETPTAKAKK